MPLVGYVAARFVGRGYDYDDLYQYGCIGLIKAVDRFDPEYGVTFSTYAVPLIMGEIKRFLRSDGAVHVSRTIRENSAKIAKIVAASEKDGRTLALDEVCKAAGLDRQEAVLAMSAMIPAKSLHEPVTGDGDLLLQDMIGNDQGERINDNIALRQMLERLEADERELIVRRYFKRNTQTEIARDLDMTQVQISRLEKKILEKMRNMLV